MNDLAGDRSPLVDRGSGTQKATRPVSLVLTAVISVLIGTAAGLAAFYPQLLGLGIFSGFMHAVALRGLTLAGMFVLILLVLACLGLLLIRRSFGRRFFGLLGGTAAMLTITLVALSGFLSGGVSPRSDPALAEERIRTDTPATDITVINANVLYTNSDYDDVFARVDPQQPTIIALQEAVRTQVDTALSKYRLTDRFAITSPTPSASVETDDSMLLVTHELSPVEIDAAGLPFATAGMITDVGYVYSIHTYAPVARSLRQTAWADSVREALSYCNGNALIAGDFNATVNHQVMGETVCWNAADSLEMISAASWPSRLPSPLGARIDHQYTGISGLEARRGEVFRISGSDHHGLEISYRWYH